MTFGEGQQPAELETDPLGLYDGVPVMNIIPERIGVPYPRIDLVRGRP